MKKETDEMLNIIHKNHEAGLTQYKIEQMLKRDRQKIQQEKERKMEMAEQRSLVMVSIALILLVFKIWGLV